MRSPSRLEQLMAALAKCPLPIIWPAHPGALDALASMNMVGQLERLSNVRVVPPQSHMRLISLGMHSRLIMTDSGGLQREAYFLAKPCVVLRSATEFPETIVSGAGCLALNDSSLLVEAVADMAMNDTGFQPDLGQFGGGHAAEGIAGELAAFEPPDFPHSGPALESVP